jgi:hypothetical protein
MQGAFLLGKLYLVSERPVMPIQIKYLTKIKRLCLYFIELNIHLPSLIILLNSLQ